jgi:hypothetical protein
MCYDIIRRGIRKTTLRLALHEWGGDTGERIRRPTVGRRKHPECRIELARVKTGGGPEGRGIDELQDRRTMCRVLRRWGLDDSWQVVIFCKQ